jgi:hypothetical protein
MKTVSIAKSYIKNKNVSSGFTTCFQRTRKKGSTAVLYVINLRIFLVFRQNENPTAEREGGEQAGRGSQEGFKQAQEASHEVQDDEENHVHPCWRRYQSMH